MSDDIEAKICHYITTEILADDASEVTVETPLLEWGILNSLEVLGLVDFLESTFDIQVHAHDLSPHNLSSVKSIAQMVRDRGP